MCLPRFLSVLLVPAALHAAGTVKFNRDIRPVMSDTCFRCHGPDKSSRMAGLRLDIRDLALQRTKSGVTPIVPGDPEHSAVIQRIFSTSAAKVMPPKYSHKELTAAQKDLIRRWIAEGAQYEGHWVYQPVQRPAIPDIPNASNPVDAFIRDRLAREKLEPSPEADKRTLIRRVTLDLTGLPPTPEEVAAFIADTGPDAYEKVVDRLLASPHYAEMRAMHWLDAVRYADSAGFHGDNLWPAWPYRDYVLRAFRDNTPFDQFTREQLAGDLLPDATIDQKIAATYNRLNRVSAEGGIQPKEYLAKYGADRVRTTSTVWLGATMGCAECHDHKFDPFTSKDFYSMKAFFADVKETGLVPDRGAPAWGSKLFLPTAEQRSRLEQLDREIDDALTQLDRKALALGDERAAWENDILKRHGSGELAWRYQRPVSAASANGAKLTIYNDEPLDSNFYLVGPGGASLASERKRGNGIIVASGANPDNETYIVTVRPGKGTWTALGIDVLQDESLPGNRLSRGADRFVLSEVEAVLSAGGKQAGVNLPFILATSTGFGQVSEQSAMFAIDGDPKTGWGASYGEGRNQFLALRFAAPVHTDANSTMTVKLRHDSDYRRATIGRFRVALSEGKYSWPETGEASQKSRVSHGDVAALSVPVDLGMPPLVLRALRTPADRRTAVQRSAILEHFEWSSPELQPLVARIAKMDAERGLVESQVARVMLTEATTPRITRILPRANWMDETSEIVQPAVPAFLGKLNTGGRRATRLDLANWIVSDENPLTARVYVNRLWRQFFGTGISKTLEDLGSQGEWPVHPELLDWLASEFMHPSWQAAGAHAWDVKHIVRTIVTSQTYRQSSMSNTLLDERDPDNRLLARQSRFRTDAEVVHDLALSISGLLSDKFGGPSVRPYQPEGYLAALNFPKREYSASRGADLYRRGLYTQWQRTFVHPTLATFDAPSREECSVNRVNSNTPLQALVLLNDPIFVEAARVFAQNAIEHGGRRFDKELDWEFSRALSRAPTAAERRILSGLYRNDLKRFRADREAATRLAHAGEAPLPAKIAVPELAAMTTVTRAILNLHETITRN